MYASRAAAIVQMLLSCHSLFPEVDYSPNFVTMTSFQHSPTEGITVQEWKNGSEGVKKRIKFSGKAIDSIQLQMVEKDGKMVLGGQVSKIQGQENPSNCPVAGDLEELHIITTIGVCGPNCFYRLKDMAYMINQAAGYSCAAIDLSGKPVWNKLEQPELDCSSPLGLKPDENLFVFVKDGECRQVDYSVLNISWTPSSCSPPEIYLEPNRFSKYYHLRYLMTTSGCGENITDNIDFDNIYVKFLHKNETLVESTETPSTTKVIVHEEEFNYRKWLPCIIMGSLGILLVVVLVILGVVYRKKLKPYAVGCCQKMKFMKKTVPGNPETPSEAEERKLEKEREEWEKQAIIREKKGQDTEGNEDDNLKSFNPMNVLMEHKLVEGETVYDKDIKTNLPMTIDCFQPYRHYGFLGAGTFGSVYQYEKMSQPGTYVAVKFVPTADPKKLFDAKREFMLIRQIQRKFKANEEFYILQVLDVGTYPEFVFIVSPLYYRCMTCIQDRKFMKWENAQIFCAAWHFLKGIQQLHSVGYGHNDIKPANYMQKTRDSNTMVLCDFGMVKLFGSKRKRWSGTAIYLPFTTYELKDTSNVDDYQSWLFLFVFMLQGFYGWDVEVLRDRESVPEMAKTKREYFDGLLRIPEGKRDHKQKLYCNLYARIVDGHGPENPVKVEEVMQIMKDLEKAYCFKYNDIQWWDVR